VWREDEANRLISFLPAFSFATLITGIPGNSAVSSALIKIAIKIEGQGS
jgi:hypothetical protein